MKLTNLSLPYIKERYRLILWLLLISLTTLILLFPTHLRYEYSIYPVPYSYIFDNLPLFGAIYYIWLLSLLMLLFSKRGEGKGDWERVALLGIFALVFAGFTVFLTHSLFGDAFVPAADIKNLAEQGRFLSASALKYIGSPAFALLGSSVTQITGLKVIDYIPLFPVFQILLFSTLLYLLFSKSLKNPYLASLGVLLVIQGNTVVSTLLSHFHAGAFAPFSIFAALVVFLPRDKARTWQYSLIFVILLSALSVSHFVTSTAFFLVILGIYIVQQFGKRHPLTSSLVMLCLIVPLTWQLYQTYEVFRGLAMFIPKAIEDFQAGGTIVRWLLPLQTTSYVGERAPIWASVCWYLWPLLTVIFGGVLGLSKLAKVRSLDSSEVKEIGGLVGVGMLGLLLLLLGGIQDSFGRTLVYIALFTVPILLRWVTNLKVVMRKYSLLILVILFFSLSFPTFLANPKGISGSTYYPYELASGEFLESSYGNGDGLRTYGMGGSSYYLTYYTPKAQLNEAATLTFRSRDEDDIWRSVNAFLTSFENSRWPQGASILAFSAKWDAPFRDYLGIDPKASQQWSQLKSRLAKNNMIYNNGFVQFYELNGSP